MLASRLNNANGQERTSSQVFGDARLLQISKQVVLWFWHQVVLVAAAIVSAATVYSVV